MDTRRADQRIGMEWVIVLASALHLIWGVLIWQSAAPYATTPIAGIHSILGDLGGRVVAGSVLCAVALLALWSMYLHKNIFTLLMLLPQEAFLVMSASSVVLAMIQGHYADEVIRARAFIAADQILYLLLAILYPCAIWQAYIWKAFMVRQRGDRGGT